MATSEVESREKRTYEDDRRSQLICNSEQLTHKLRPVAQVFLNQLRPHDYVSRARVRWRLCVACWELTHLARRLQRLS